MQLINSSIKTKLEYFEVCKTANSEICREWLIKNVRKLYDNAITPLKDLEMVYSFIQITSNYLTQEL